MSMLVNIGMDFTVTIRKGNTLAVTAAVGNSLPIWVLQSLVLLNTLIDREDKLVFVCLCKKDFFCIFSLLGVWHKSKFCI